MGNEDIENTLNEELPEDEEQLVADLLGEFSERSHRGERLTMKEFFDRCPNDRYRRHFRILVNMSQLVDLNEAVNRAERDL